ncbi:M23 family metallopeptidase [Geodermatophilus sp. YIM 151500]|uniref:M23 family metallopeptidase n=1 Tax=Geodermatophilus sp. YIM 151500 TaxID=2984531 RepID=UPI0021E437F7|nr:M23 family metallopeptidase [Geodermatophilus sp. YIM 151500]MCV2491584.1 M23 family metallopeptidase [Geodermatophilus sp. YIM 151500]
MSPTPTDRLPREGEAPEPGSSTSLVQASGTPSRRTTGTAERTTGSAAAAPREGTRGTAEVRRPVPHPRTAPDAAGSGAGGPAVREDAAEGAPAAPRRARRLPSGRRRPALYLAAALVGALGVAASTTVGPAAQAETAASVSRSVSVAEQLGIQSGPAAAIPDAVATERLGDLAASRAQRETEQAVAAQAQAEADRLAAEAAAAAAAEAARPKIAAPVDGGRLTSRFGPRWGRLHAGIDIAAPMGTPERAVADGVVLEAGPASGYGLVVYVQHANGDVTVYGHMSEILVTPGQVVKAGDTIALLGNRGQSTGPHLHLEVRVGGLDGPPIDPLPWLRERGLEL